MPVCTLHLPQQLSEQIPLHRPYQEWELQFAHPISEVYKALLRCFWVKSFCENHFSSLFVELTHYISYKCWEPVISSGIFPPVRIIYPQTSPLWKESQPLCSARKKICCFMTWSNVHVRESRGEGHQAALGHTTKLEFIQALLKGVL